LTGHLDEVIYSRKAIVVFTLKEGEGTDFILLFAAAPRQFDMFKELIISRPFCMLRLKVAQHTASKFLFCAKDISIMDPSCSNQDGFIP
jgi:hypothetical protein